MVHSAYQKKGHELPRQWTFKNRTNVLIVNDLLKWRSRTPISSGEREQREKLTKNGKKSGGLARAEIHENAKNALYVGAKKKKTPTDKPLRFENMAVGREPFA